MLAVAHRDAFSAATIEMPHTAMAARFCKRRARAEFPIEDAIANVRVIDAAFRSARSGGWEKP